MCQLLRDCHSFQRVITHLTTQAIWVGCVWKVLSGVYHTKHTHTEISTHTHTHTHTKLVDTDNLSVLAVCVWKAKLKAIPSIILAQSLSLPPSLSLTHTHTLTWVETGFTSLKSGFRCPHTQTHMLTKRKSMYTPAGSHIRPTVASEVLTLLAQVSDRPLFWMYRWDYTG